MANQTKQNLTTLGQIQSDTQVAYLSASMIAAPNTQITDLSGNARQIRDPSKTLRPAMGIERVHFNVVDLLKNQKGSNGENVYAAVKGDDRVRLVGTWVNNPGSFGTQVYTTTLNEYAEITFYGTGLNILLSVDASVRDYRATIDGGVEGGNWYSVGALSGVTGGRNYSQRSPFNVASGLALGVHTVKLKLHAGPSMVIQGFEVLNQSVNINIPQGEIVSNGKKEVIAALTTTSYNSGFDGSPVLNGRGGRVVIYSKNGQIGKAIQQTNASQANLTSANHLNEKEIRIINFREFGANRADDLSTLAGAGSDRAFTLDDGTTNLSVNNMQVTSNALTHDNVIGAFFTITFVGTGLDFALNNGDNATLSGNAEVFVDGISVSSTTWATLFGTTTRRNGVYKLVSGLPYGTHTVRVANLSTGTNRMQFDDFIIYGPKRPTIPEGSSIVGEYYLMANWSTSNQSGTGLADTMTFPLGSLFKQNLREFTYSGTWAVSGFQDDTLGGFTSFTTTNASFVEYTFLGDNIVIHSASSSAGTADFTVTIDGVLNTAGVALSNASNLGGGSYRHTSTTQGAPARLSFSGLSFGRHTIRLTKTAGAGGFAPNFHVSSLIHYPNTKRGSLALNPNIASFPRQDESGSVDLGKAKALMLFDGVSEILSSTNIAAVIREAVGVYHVYFEKPFKNSFYVVACDNLGNARTSAIGKLPNKFEMRVQVNSVAADIPGGIAVFGELSDEEND